MNGACASPIYRETVLVVLAFIFVSGIVTYFLRKKNYYFIVSCQYKKLAHASAFVICYFRRT